MSPLFYLKRKKKTITPKQNKSSMSPIVLSKEKRRQYLERKEDHNTKTKQKFYVIHCFIYRKKITITPNQKFYVTHCFI